METLQILTNPKLTLSAKVVYIYIRDKKLSTLRYEDIAEALGTSSRTVEIAIMKLKSQGLLTVESLNISLPTPKQNNIGANIEPEPKPRPQERQRPVAPANKQQSQGLAAPSGNGADEPPAKPDGNGGFREPNVEMPQRLGSHLRKIIPPNPIERPNLPPPPPKQVGNIELSQDTIVENLVRYYRVKAKQHWPSTNFPAHLEPSDKEAFRGLLDQGRTKEEIAEAIERQDELGLDGPMELSEFVANFKGIQSHLKQADWEKQQARNVPPTEPQPEPQQELPPPPHNQMSSIELKQDAESLLAFFHEELKKHCPSLKGFWEHIDDMDRRAFSLLLSAGKTKAEIIEVIKRVGEVLTRDNSSPISFRRLIHLLGGPNDWDAIAERAQLERKRAMAARQGEAQ